MQINFVGGAYLSRSLNLDCQRCVNLMPVLGESGNAKSVKALFGTPGLRLLSTLGGSGGLRALYRPSVGDAIAVQGASVYRITTGLVATLVGYVDSLATPVDIKDNGTTAVLVTGPNGYTLDLGTNVLAQIIDDAFYGAARVSYNDTSFIFEKPGSNLFYITAADGTVTFDALDFSTAESNAEPIVSHIVNHGELILFKRSVTEVWRDTGGADFPYTRDDNAAIEQGCAAKYSVVALDNTVFWLGGDKTGEGIVWRMNGYTPQRVSHGGVETAIQGYSDISDAVAYAYQQEGHTFYVISFPTGGATWVYDVATQLWHERAYLDPATGTFGRHRSNCHMYFAGLHIVGDWQNGNLYALDLNYFSDNGDPLVALRSAPHQADQDYHRIRFDSIQVDIEAGVGLQSGQGAAPLMMIRWSDDGGHTWCPLKTMSMGAVGKFRTRAKRNRLGKARDRVFEVSISDPVKRVILGAAVQATGLQS